MVDKSRGLFSRNVDLLISRLILGYWDFNFEGNKIRYNPPCVETIYEADFFYAQILEQEKWGDFLTIQEAERSLIDKGIWSKEKDNQLVRLEKDISDIKLALYKAHKDKLVVAKNVATKQLKKAKEEYFKLVTEKTCLYNGTLESYADYCKNIFLTQKTVVIPNAYKDNIGYILRLANKISEERITDYELRILVRTDNWLTYKEMGVFNTMRNIEQLSAASMTSLYSKILSHPECPDDETLLDKDLLDGWFSFIKDEAKKEKLKQEIDSKTSGGQNAFVVVGKDQEKAKEVIGLNKNFNIGKMFNGTKKNA